MNILQVCAYSAPYAGNFINALKFLGKELNKEGHNVLYAFPETARNVDWCKQLNRSNKLFYLPLARARIKRETYKDIKRIVE